MEVVRYNIPKIRRGISIKRSSICSDDAIKDMEKIQAIRRSKIKTEKKIPRNGTPRNGTPRSGTCSVS